MKYYLSIALLCCLFACCSSVKDDNLELTTFTKELVCTYLNDEQNVSVKKTDEIIIQSFIDDTFYHLSIFANNPNEYSYCSNDYLGQTKFMGHTVKAFGKENNLFFLLIKKTKWKKRCNPSYAEYDPIVWYICLYKDGSLCSQETSKWTSDEDISIIQSLVNKHFCISSPQ